MPAPKKMKTMGTTRGYRPPSLDLPGKFNAPKPGRVAKMLPSIKQFRPLPQPRKPTK